MGKENLNNYAISEQTFEWILLNLPKGSTILELGSGKGTIELSKFYNVYSIEHAKRWLNVCKDSTYIYAPIKNYNIYTWYDIEVLKKSIPEKYDFLLVDGPPKRTGGRIGLFYNLDLFKKNIPMLFDDVQRTDDLDNMNSIAEKLHKKYEIFKGNRKKFGVLYV